MKKIDTILFDFDGTLVNTNDVIIDSWQHLYKKFKGREATVEEITPSFGEPLLLTLEREFSELDPEEAAEEYRKYQSEYAYKKVGIFEGMNELLETLKEKAYQMAIVTSRTKESAIRYLEMLGLRDYFEDIVSCDDTQVHKPAPEPIYLALEKLGKEKEQVIMVGDGPFDIKCANNAGVKSVLVGWRITGESPNIKEWETDFQIEKPMDLIELLEK